MTNKKKPSLLVFWLCCIAILIAPLTANTTKTKLTDSSKGVIRDSDTVISVTNKGVSSSGFVYCTFVIEKPIQKQLVGPCTTTDDLVLKVGWDYTTSKFNLGEGGKIIIYKATPIDSKVKLQVVQIKYLAGHTRVAILSNGDKVSGTNLNVGDYVSVR
jgi:hypothetical protein